MKYWRVIPAPGGNCVVVDESGQEVEGVESVSWAIDGESGMAHVVFGDEPRIRRWVLVLIDPEVKRWANQRDGVV